MKKRVLSMLLAIVMVVGLMPGVSLTAFAAETNTSSQGGYSGGNGTEADPYIISTVADMLAFHEAISNDDGSLDAADSCGLGMYHGYYFKLGNNIDMSGVEWSPVSFCGNLDGAGFAIRNLSVTEADNGDDEYWSAMFAQLINATVSNITFENCSASISDEVSSSRDVYAAIVAANAIASKLENIRVVNCSVTQNGYAPNFGYAAFVAALADISNITGCIVEGGEISVKPTTSCTMLAGGITGCFEDLFYEYIADYGNPYNMEIGAGADYGIYDCYVNADITVNADASSHTAGIVGMTCTDYLDDTAEFNGKAVEIKNCMYEGTIIAESGSVGGISGWDEPQDHIIDCVSLATVSASKSFPLCELPETVTNSYYLAAEETEDGGKTEEQFASGAVCTTRGGHFAVDGVCMICGSTTYYVAIAPSTTNGTVTADVYKAAEGDPVTLTVTPNSGYEFDALTVKDASNNDVSVTDNTFTMPASSVTVTATFRAKTVHTVLADPADGTPQKNGYVFAGWYSDEASKQPCSSVPTAQAYAKFVPSEVLGVKVQVTAGTTASSQSTNIRFITSVDCLDYKDVTVKVTIKEITEGAADRQYTLTDTVVYKRISASGESGDLYNYDPIIFSSCSTHFMTHIITGVPQAYFDTDITATAYWTTADGTVVEGMSRTFKVSEGYEQ